MSRGEGPVPMTREEQRKMDKCEGCPFWFEDNNRQQPCCGARGGRYLEDIHDPCHLTPSDMEAIRNAIAGEEYLISIHKNINRESLESMIAYALDL